MSSPLSLISQLSAQTPIQTTPIQPANQQAPAENPLDQLKDIHLPEQVDQFPYAPGWWILLALIIITIGYFIYRHLKYKKAIRLLKPAKTELDALRSVPLSEVGASSVATLSALLKRICLIYFPSQQVASLNGRAWLEFLNQQNRSNESSPHTPLFSEKDILLFCELPYQKTIQIEQSDWNSLLASSEKCISNIVINAAKAKIKKRTSKERKIA